MELMKITGKRGRIVPVLLTEDMVTGINALLAVRNKYIPEENEFLFGVSASKRSSNGWTALKSITTALGGKLILVFENILSKYLLISQQRTECSFEHERFSVSRFH